MKKLIGVILLFILFTAILPVGAAKEEINFLKAQELVLKNNIDLKIAELTLANSQIDQQKSQLTAQANTLAEQLNMALDLCKSQDAYRVARYNIISGLINDYFELTKRRLTVEVNENLLKIKEIDLKQVNNLFAKGSSTSTDVKNARTAVDEQKLVLEKSKIDLANLIENLKIKMGLSGEIAFREPVINLIPINYDLQKALQDAAKASFDLNDKNIRLQLAILEFEKSQLENKPALEIQKLNNNKQIAAYRLELAKESLEQNVKDQLNTLDQTRKTIEIKTLELEVANENYLQITAGYKKGHYTESQYLQSKVAFLNAEKALLISQADYLAKLGQFTYLVGNDKLIGGELK